MPYKAPRDDLSWTKAVVSSPGLIALLPESRRLEITGKVVVMPGGEWRRIGISQSWRFWFRTRKLGLRRVER